MDRNKAITAEDLIIRYDLENLKKDRAKINNSNNSLTNTSGIIKGFVSSVLKGFQNIESQVDDMCIAWFFDGEPTLLNSPADEWTTDVIKNTHLGDLYYDKETGYTYIFDLTDNVYSWVRVYDNDVIESMALANATNDAEDNKRKIFFATPTTPYETGDIWFSNNEILRSRLTRSSGTMDGNDWIKNDEYLNIDYSKNVEAIITFMEQNYLITTKLEKDTNSITLEVANKVDNDSASIILAINGGTGSSAEIKASKISLAGKTIDLTGDTIVIDSTKFKVDADGNMQCSNASITGGNLELTDNPGISDRFLIKKNNSTEETTITSEYFVSRKDPNDEYNYCAMSQSTGFTTSLGSSSEYTSANLKSEWMRLTSKSNGTTKRTTIATDNSSISGNLAVDGKLTVGNINGVYLKSADGISSATITSSNGYGRLWIFASNLITFIAFEGDGVNATVHDMIGTHQFSVSTNGKIITITGLYNWDHYIFIGSNVISNITTNLD